MGYTICYEGASETPLTAAQRAIVQANVEEWQPKLSDDAEGYAWSFSEDGCMLSGLTKPGMDEDDMDQDIEVLVSAVRALQAALPSVQFTVSDDFDMPLFP